MRLSSVWKEGDVSNSITVILNAAQPQPAMTVLTIFIPKDRKGKGPLDYPHPSPKVSPLNTFKQNTVFTWVCQTLYFTVEPNSNTLTSPFTTVRNELKPRTFEPIILYNSKWNCTQTEPIRHRIKSNLTWTELWNFKPITNRTSTDNSKTNCSWTKLVRLMIIWTELNGTQTVLEPNLADLWSFGPNSTDLQSFQPNLANFQSYELNSADLLSFESNSSDLQLVIRQILNFSILILLKFTDTSLKKYRTSLRQVSAHRQLRSKSS